MFHVKVASRTLTDSSPSFETGSSNETALLCSSSAAKKLVRRLTATVASMIDVITIGRMASGKVRRLNKVSAGKMISPVNGVSFVNTKIVKVEQETKNGVVLLKTN